MNSELGNSRNGGSDIAAVTRLQSAGRNRINEATSIRRCYGYRQCTGAVCGD
jgi:hypothetical protein